MRGTAMDHPVQSVWTCASRVKAAKHRGILFGVKTPVMLLLALLAGCASSPSVQQPSPNAGRYQLAQDRAPTRVLDPSEISEVVPTAVTRTMAGNRSPYEVLGKRYTVDKD
jgi:hypothetical protein